MTGERSWVTVQDLLQEETRDELASRDGQWTAFREQVQWRLDREDGAVRQMSWQDQAIHAFAEEVEKEVASVSPRFEGMFREELENRIFERGIERRRCPAWIDALRATFSARPGWAMVGGLAAAAVVAGLGLGPAPGPAPGDGDGAPVPSIGASGAVNVDALSFEGSATVTVDEGVTVVMLASAN